MEVDDLILQVLVGDQVSCHFVSLTAVRGEDTVPSGNQLRFGGDFHSYGKTGPGAVGELESGCIPRPTAPPFGYIFSNRMFVMSFDDGRRAAIGGRQREAVAWPLNSKARWRRTWT
jgi:hypothetical protein